MSAAELKLRSTCWTKRTTHTHYQLWKLTFQSMKQIFSPYQFESRFECRQRLKFFQTNRHLISLSSSGYQYSLTCHCLEKI